MIALNVRRTLISRGGVQNTRLEAKAKDTGASVLQKNRSSTFFFRRSPKQKNKKGLRKFSARFLAFFNNILTVQKCCCPRAEDRAIFEDLRLPGQELNLRGQGRP